MDDAVAGGLVGRRPGMLLGPLARRGGVAEGIAGSLARWRSPVRSFGRLPGRLLPGPHDGPVVVGLAGRKAEGGQEAPLAHGCGLRPRAARGTAEAGARVGVGAGSRAPAQHDIPRRGHRRRWRRTVRDSVLGHERAGSGIEHLRSGDPTRHGCPDGGVGIARANRVRRGCFSGPRRLRTAGGTRAVPGAGRSAWGRRLRLALDLAACAHGSCRWSLADVRQVRQAGAGVSRHGGLQAAAGHAGSRILLSQQRPAPSVLRRSHRAGPVARLRGPPITCRPRRASCAGCLRPGGADEVAVDGRERPGATTPSSDAETRR